MTQHVIGTVAEIPPGQRKIVEVGGISVGVFNVRGTFYALRNRCPHQGAPLCLGALTGTALPSAPGEYLWACEGEILRCPWHGWEFDLRTGRSLFNPSQVRVRSYEVSIESVPDVEGEREDPAVEAYPVTIEADRIVLHL